MPKQPTDFNELIPELREWNHGAGIDPIMWIDALGNYTHAVGYSVIFWPEFIEHDGCVLLASNFSPENYAEWFTSYHGERWRVEEMINHTHIAGLFSQSEPTKPILRYLGRIIREMWHAKLRQDFPQRTFTVSFEDGDFDWWLDYQVTFCQSDHPPHAAEDAGDAT